MNNVSMENVTTTTEVTSESAIIEGLRDLFLQWSTNYDFFLTKISIILFPILAIISGVANIMCFVNVIVHRSTFPPTSRIFMAIIMLNDALTVLIVLPYFLMALLLESSMADKIKVFFKLPGTVNLGVCYVSEAVLGYFVYGAVYFQLGLSVERFLAIVYPLKVGQFLRQRNLILLVLLTTLLSLIVPIMRMAAHTWDHELSDEYRCVPRSRVWDEVFVMTDLYVGRVIPYSLLIVASASVIFCLIRSIRQMQQFCDHQDKHTRERQRTLIRVSYMLIYQIMLHLLGGLPGAILLYVEKHYQSTKYQDKPLAKPAVETLLAYFEFLLFLNNLFTWPIYFIGHKFRSCFISLFCRPFVKLKPRDKGLTGAISTTQQTEVLSDTRL